MRSRHIVHTINSHTGGEPTRLIVSGFPVRGSSLLEQREYVRKNYDWLRAILIREPRGHRGMFGAIMCPPTRPEVDFGIIWAVHDGVHLNMCGHASIGIGMVAVECSLVPVTEPLTELRVDMPVGMVKIETEVKDGRAQSASLTNVPAFVYATDIPIDVPGHGEVRADISFGGSFFGAVRSEALGIPVSPENAARLVQAGVAVRKALNEKVQLRHPLLDHIRSVDLVTIYGPGLAPGAKYKNIHIFADGQFDRSPGGTGTSHMMAMLIHRGEMHPDETIVSEEISGTLFRGRMVGRTKVGTFDAFIPKITGEAYLTGFHQFVIDPNDPLDRGLSIS